MNLMIHVLRVFDLIQLKKIGLSSNLFLGIPSVIHRYKNKNDKELNLWIL